MNRMTQALAVLCLVAGCRDAGQVEIATGNVHASHREYDQAIAAYQAAAKALPHQAKPRELLGHVLFDLRRYPEARAAYEDAVKVDPEGAREARIGLARIDGEQGNLDAAIDTLGKVLESDRGNVYAWLSRANLLLRRARQQDVELAIADAQSAKQIDGKNVSTLYTLGCARIAARDFPGANQEFDALAQREPNSPLAPYGRARTASAQGLTIKALAELQEARAKSKQDWKPDEVRSDPAFRAIKDDPKFAEVIGG